MGVLTITRRTTEAGEASCTLEGLRALILLGGTVWTGQLGACTGRPTFDLPLETGCTILDAWRREAASLSAGGGLGPGAVPVRVMINRNAPEREGRSAEEGTRTLAPVRIERDPFDYRGTGGVLRDLAAEYADDDLLLVGNAAQVLTEPLSVLASDLFDSGGDVSLVSHLDGTPSGMMLVRCGALRHVPASGFHDMKEQALPLIAQRFDVTVVTRRKPTGLPVRTLDDYIEALRYHHKARARKDGDRTAALAGSAFEEDWESSFALVEEGAYADPGARLHDAVVLRGGRVEADACLVHSVVCAGGVLRRGEMRVDDFVRPHGAGKPDRRLQG